VDLVDHVGQHVVHGGPGERLGAPRADPRVEHAQPLERDAARQVVRLGRPDIA
jgi:hypothetical protein